jgi:hypothetical protein
MSASEHQGGQSCQRFQNWCLLYQDQVQERCPRRFIASHHTIIADVGGLTCGIVMDDDWRDVLAATTLI